MLLAWLVTVPATALFAAAALVPWSGSHEHEALVPSRQPGPAGHAAGPDRDHRRGDGRAAGLVGGRAPGPPTGSASCEHRADKAKRELWLALREAFSPPLDAEDLYTLSADLDEVLNASKDLVREMEVMDMQPDEPIHEMVDPAWPTAVGHLADAFDQLDTKGDATEYADAAIKSQRRIEHAYRRAMSALLQVEDLHEVIGRREVYRRLSRIGDLVHVVAERVWYAVVKES